MKQNNIIEAKVEETLDSLAGIQRAEPSPFFFTRLQARLVVREKSFWSTVTTAITRPAFAFVIVLIVILLNSFVIFFASDDQKNDSVEVALAEEYRLNASLYNLENAIP